MLFHQFLSFTHILRIHVVSFLLILTEIETTGSVKLERKKLASTENCANKKKTKKRFSFQQELESQLVHSSNSSLSAKQSEPTPEIIEISEQESTIYFSRLEPSNSIKEQELILKRSKGNLKYKSSEIKSHNSSSTGLTPGGSKLNQNSITLNHTNEPLFDIDLKNGSNISKCRFSRKFGSHQKLSEAQDFITQTDDQMENSKVSDLVLPNTISESNLLGNADIAPISSFLQMKTNSRKKATISMPESINDESIHTSDLIETNKTLPNTDSSNTNKHETSQLNHQEEAIATQNPDQVGILHFKKTENIAIDKYSGSDNNLMNEKNQLSTHINYRNRPQTQKTMANISEIVERMQSLILKDMVNYEVSKDDDSELISEIFSNGSFLDQLNGFCGKSDEKRFFSYLQSEKLIEIYKNIPINAFINPYNYFNDIQSQLENSFPKTNFLTLIEKIKINRQQFGFVESLDDNKCTFDLPDLSNEKVQKLDDFYNNYTIQNTYNDKECKYTDVKNDWRHIEDIFNGLNVSDEMLYRFQEECKLLRISFKKEGVVFQDPDLYNQLFLEPNFEIEKLFQSHIVPTIQKFEFNQEKFNTRIERLETFQKTFIEMRILEIRLKRYREVLSAISKNNPTDQKDNKIKRIDEMSENSSQDPFKNHNISEISGKPQPTWLRLYRSLFRIRPTEPDTRTFEKKHSSHKNAWDDYETIPSDQKILKKMTDKLEMEVNIVKNENNMYLLTLKDVIAQNVNAFRFEFLKMRDQVIIFNYQKMTYERVIKLDLKPIFVYKNEWLDYTSNPNIEKRPLRQINDIGVIISEKTNNVNYVEKYLERNKITFPADFLDKISYSLIKHPFFHNGIFFDRETLVEYTKHKINEGQIDFTVALDFFIGPIGEKIPNKSLGVERIKRAQDFYQSLKEVRGLMGRVGDLLEIYERS